MAPPSSNPGERVLSANELIFREAMRETRETLARWNAESGRIVLFWALISCGIAVGMLVAVMGVAQASRADVTFYLPSMRDGDLEDLLRVLFRNSLVLALHAFVCVAGFMAMRALPEQVKHKSGIDRWVHEHAGRFAMLWVTAATLFSMGTQIYVLGHNVADIAFSIGVGIPQLMLTVLPHAVLELTAVFLPLAAFLVASRRREWHELLAATAVTVGVAVPALVIAASVEAYLWPTLLRAIVS